ncbi:hypothetical protein [Marinimicrobium koreense]|uniref:hypothetical protein n=1 Tax=Marinimicrobium koreense TaxID=306545 RepID=UPI003F711A2D
MKNLLTAQAYQAFVKGRYHSARNAYLKVAENLGSHLYQANLELCERREARTFLGKRQLVPEPLITYCVPAMNRLDDLRKTLPINLNVLKDFRSVRLMINLFDAGDEASRWITSGFSGELASGCLILNQLPPMEGWHMSKGKNSFQPFLSEGYYSSLDSDNYLSVDEIVKTKQAITEFGDCLIHHFSGHWGDGTCGHITLPVDLYHRSGYTNELYPRQFDELSLIANAIAEQPDMPVVTRHGVNIFQKTLFLREFITLNRLSPQVIPCRLGEAPPPKNGKTDSYAEQDLTLKYYSELNGYYAIYRASVNQHARRQLLDKLWSVQSAALQSPIGRQLAFATLKCDKEALKRFPLPDDTHFAVVERIDDSFVTWLNFQRRRGSKAFILIDVTADQAVGTLHKAEDVLVMTPRVGDVESFKDFWIHCAKIMAGTSVSARPVLNGVKQCENVG